MTSIDSLGETTIAGGGGIELRLTNGFYMYDSNYKNMLAVVMRRLPFWSPNDVGYSHLLSMQAFGMQATGRLDAAEALAEKALSMNGNDRWACK